MGFINFHKCLTEPKYFLRLIAVILCLCVAFYQLSECVRKILHPPISTHYTFNLNRTMQYPSITVCRNPPYKTSVYEKYGIPSAASPHKASFWSYFNYDKFTLDQFFAEATYKFKEVIPFFGFDSQLNDLDVTSFLKLRYGLCFKFTPRNYSSEWHGQKGYMIYMTHTVMVKTTDAVTRSSLAGYHIYVHEPRDIITDSNDQGGSFMEYVYLDAGEDSSYTLRTHEYNQLPGREYNCSTDFFYSRSTCVEKGLHKKITEEVGCSTPWMENDLLQRCNAYNQTRQIVNLYNAYSKNYEKYITTCPRSCNISIYIPYVQSRSSLELPNSFLSIYYSSNLVTVMEEVTGYDWNDFLADLGGSLGFLLGLSVLGIIGAIEQLLKLCICSRISKAKKKETPKIFVNGEKIDEAEEEKEVADLNYYIDYYGKSNVLFDRDNNIKY